MSDKLMTQGIRNSNIKVYAANRIRSANSVQSHLFVFWRVFLFGCLFEVFYGEKQNGWLPTVDNCCFKHKYSSHFKGTNFLNYYTFINFFPLEIIIGDIFM